MVQESRRRPGAGLRALRGKPFHLVVSDYWLPDRIGAWMLSEASHSGLLSQSAVLHMRRRSAG
jgi:hypothetical protein